MSQVAFSLHRNLHQFIDDYGEACGPLFHPFRHFTDDLLRLWKGLYLYRRKKGLYLKAEAGAWRITEF
ncbi:unnamed protein product [Cylicocyclus nassatus]|uniref:Uncharacterized protein n=1 Tax=Cylicocyclus nassatus TaxID=53992 RepID=A0AA36GNF7_CYLNA|nr:unnamed protein product [Cylicocyclus nassatus]